MKKISKKRMEVVVKKSDPNSVLEFILGADDKVKMAWLAVDVAIEYRSENLLEILNLLMPHLEVDHYDNFYPESAPFSSLKQLNTRVLQLAASKGCVESIKVLIQQSNPEYNDCAALYEAAENGHVQAVQVLLPVSSSRKVPSQALRIACINGNLEVARQFARVVSPICISYGFEHAAACGQVEVMSFFLNKLPAEIDQVALYSRGLEAASRSGEKDAANLLLSLLKELPRPPGFGKRALYEAAVDGHVEIMNGILSIADETVEADQALGSCLASGHHIDSIDILMRYVKLKNSIRLLLNHRGFLNFHAALVREMEKSHASMRDAVKSGEISHILDCIEFSSDPEEMGFIAAQWISVFENEKLVDVVLPYLNCATVCYLLVRSAIKDDVDTISKCVPLISRSKNKYKKEFKFCVEEAFLEASTRNNVQVIKAILSAFQEDVQVVPFDLTDAVDVTNALLEAVKQGNSDIVDLLMPYVDDEKTRFFCKQEFLRRYDEAVARSIAIMKRSELEMSTGALSMNAIPSISACSSRYRF